ncbi:MAG: regulator of amino acid metabolism, contains ACT domain protein [Methanomassiliicoccales archaeon]
MWSSLSKYFGRFPSQAKVARMLLELGLRVSNGSVYCGDIELSDSAIGRAAGVDRRIVRSTVETIESNPELISVFGKLRSTAMLKDVAPVMGWSAIEIIPVNAQIVGIVADVTGVIAKAGISIRQTIVSDPELSTEPRLYVITEAPVPPEIIPDIKACRGVKSILIH